jgi:hypothetical protein
MASVRGFQFTKYLHPEIFIVTGRLLTDSNGDVTNINDGTVKDQDGDVLYLPRGITSVAHPSTGKYVFTLDDAWFKLKAWTAQAEQPKAFGTKIGTADLTALTLSALNGETLLLTASAGGEKTTTFTTPSSVADIAAQINTAEGGSAVASILGGKYLRIIDPVAGSTSSIAMNTSSTAKTNLGLSTTANVGLELEGQFNLWQYNTRGQLLTTATDDIAAQTITLLYTQDGLLANIVSSGFAFSFTFQNLKED